MIHPNPTINWDADHRARFEYLAVMADREDTNIQREYAETEQVYRNYIEGVVSLQKKIQIKLIKKSMDRKNAIHKAQIAVMNELIPSLLLPLQSSCSSLSMTLH